MLNIVIIMIHWVSLHMDTIEALDDAESTLNLTDYICRYG